MILALLACAALLTVPSRAASLGDAQAAYAAGDYAKAAQLFKAAADAGDPVAQYNLGVLYENGQGVPKDYPQAALWYRKGAEQGYAEAQNNLANMYTFGLGVPKDLAEAVKWLQLAAQQGSSGAQYNLGIMYTLGQGVPKDFKVAEAWLRLAAQQGDAEAQYNLGVMHERGDAGAPDPADAYAWYLAASEQGYAPAAEKKAKLDAVLTAEQKASARQRAAAIKQAAAKAASAPDAAMDAAPSADHRIVWAALAVLAVSAGGGWALFRRRRTPRPEGQALPGAVFSPVPFETVLRGVKDPGACEKIARYYDQSGKTPEFVAQNQERPPEFYGAYGRGFLKAGNIPAALALLQMKQPPDPDDDKLIWTLQKAIGERQGEGWTWSARLGLALELSAQGLHDEAVSLADDEMLREAAASPAGLDGVAGLYRAAGRDAEWASRLAPPNA